MLLRLSRFVHLIPVAEGRVLVADAISHVRLVVNQEVARLLADFATPRQVPPPQPGSMLAALMERGILSDKTAEEEMAHVAQLLGPYHGRDPGELLERFRRKAKEGGDPYWAVGAALTPEELAGAGQRIDLLLLGDCDLHMESDFLRREGARRGLDLRVAATFPDDWRLAGEHRHDAVLIGALRARHAIIGEGKTPHAAFLAEARRILDGLRAHTKAPILIDNLPEPTVQPLGMAERGTLGHRNRFRAANLALAELVESYGDVHVVDFAALVGQAGSERMLDDGQFGFTHFGSPGWLLQRSETEKATVHGLFPDMAPLAKSLGGDPYGRERVMAAAHLDALMVALGIGRKKCVIVDLDGLLWPGVLAETGRPFAWHPEIGSAHSFVGLYFGLHEALKCLKRRGILLAAASKNDEATVRALWKYEDHYPRQVLLTPDDFVTWRVNWDNKVDNIRAIAAELGLALNSFLFIDDNPVERERVRQRLPEVEVWGEDPFALRRRLLDDPRLQLPRLTGEAGRRTELTKGQLNRQAARAEAVSESDFLDSLHVVTRVERLARGKQPEAQLATDLARVAELFQRTTQFNTTGARFSVSELGALLGTGGGRVYAAHVRDRFGDHGLVGAAVIRDGEIAGFALSCRVLGLGVEHHFLRHVLADLEPGPLRARIVPSARNMPARNLYRDNGFDAEAQGSWRKNI